MTPGVAANLELLRNFKNLAPRHHRPFGIARRHIESRLQPALMEQLRRSRIQHSSVINTDGEEAVDRYLILPRRIEKRAVRLNHLTVPFLAQRAAGDH